MRIIRGGHSKLDGTRKALRDGMLGDLLDPDMPDELREAVLRALQNPMRQVPEGLSHFSYSQFSRRSAEIIARSLSSEPAVQVPLWSWTSVRPRVE